MKKTIAAINPLLVYLKYLLFAASLFLGAIALAQFMKLDVTIQGGFAQAMIPFFIAAAVSMFFTKKVKIKKQ